MTGAHMTLELDGRRVGPGQPCFVIAEAGVNHNGDAALARRLVDAAAEAGADAIKFQTFDPARLVSDDAPKAEYQRRNDGAAGSQRQMLDRLVLPHALHHELRDRARARGLTFLSTPFDEASADFLDQLGVPAFKLGSGELTNHPLLAHVARKRRPLLLSTGMSTLEEVAEAVAAIRQAGDPPLALLHCVSNYPCDPAEANLRAMATLRARFGLPTGWSDHTLGIEVALAAVALGADVVEKHLTLDRELPGPDHRASLEPEQLATMVSGIRRVESALGTGVKTPTAGEREVARVARRSLHWQATLAIGDRVEPQHLTALRPGVGLPPSQLASLLGRRLRAPVQAGTLVREDQLEGAP